MLKLRDVHAHYGESHILQGVSLEVEKGSVVALLGRNGMGKTTTIHSIIGINPPSQGEITFRNHRISGLHSFKIAQMGIALVPQGRRIFRSLTVKDNLMIGYSKKTAAATDILNRIYELFPILEERSKQPGKKLSGGEQQMLAIGRAMMTEPDLLLMDEPFEGLAPTIIKEIGEKIFNLKNSGLSILLVEQNIRFATKIADFIYIMNKGKIVYGGTPEQFHADEENLKKFIEI
ncbi:amino acid/amide ABC transporter ATP-binding protein 2, HAAT family [Desulfitobacterium dichloroeliminans LMG P-21439]|uniref:Amino acid/amide ABC transporter ATP-binding protein 2, HAAT family n=1 Tax=Desulfitobacterium dichloroeliminans (strain LMG P-21439 / DCA1) TaxID=871963 RepID=L0FBX7_DESDL|nr:ABC transporter ATP-binding protein [Desulfitobacterium dichloroeliminans]AGA70453.1 amino acid/amide ABC transporter ATP-binding protein 2, HAAT family [Desulfitobacterium dichloroeliminans LMG P-21439]